MFGLDITKSRVVTLCVIFDFKYAKLHVTLIGNYLYLQIVYSLYDMYMLYHIDKYSIFTKCLLIPFTINIRFVSRLSNLL